MQVAAEAEEAEVATPVDWQAFGLGSGFPANVNVGRWKHRPKGI